MATQCIPVQGKDFIRDSLFVVDDEPGMRNALQRLFRAHSLHVEAFASAAAFLDAFQPTRSGCLVLDVHMPGMTGLELHAAMRSRGMALPVIFLSGGSDIPTAVAAMQGGAVSFLEKPFDDAVLIQQVQRAIATDAARRQLHLAAADFAARLARLTPREREVMERVIKGETNKMIARALGTSHRTVEIQRTKMMEKMQAASVADLIWLALTAGYPVSE